jgi:hypothetical protein
MASLAIGHTTISEMEVPARDQCPMYSPPEREATDSGTSETDGDSDSRVIAPKFMLAANVDQRGERQGEAADKSGAHSVPLTPPKSPSTGEREPPGHGGNASLKSLNQLHNHCELPTAVVTRGAGVGFSDDGGEKEGRLAPAKTKVTQFQKKPHHLLKHVISLESRGMNAVRELGASSIREAVDIIGLMPQKDLQKNFGLIYNARSLSNNNNWLRRKLLEAIYPSGDDTSADAMFVKEAMRSMTFTRSSKTAEERNRQAVSLKEPRRPRAAAAGVSLATAALLKEPALEYSGAGSHNSRSWVHSGHHERTLDDGRNQMKRRQGIKRSRMDIDSEEEEDEANRTTAGSDSQRELAQSLRQLATVLSAALQTTGLPGLQTLPQPAPPPPPHFLPPSFAGPGRTNFAPPFPHPPQIPFPPHHYHPYPQQCRPGGDLMPRSFPVPAALIPMSATKPQAVKLNPDDGKVLARLMNAAMEDYRIRSESQTQSQPQPQPQPQSKKKSGERNFKSAIQRAEQGLDVLRQRAKMIPGSNYPMPQLLEQLLPKASDK